MKYRTKLSRDKFGEDKKLFWIPTYENKVDGKSAPSGLFSAFNGDGIAYQNGNVGVTVKWAMFEKLEDAVKFLETFVKDNPEYQMPEEFTEDAF